MYSAKRERTGYALYDPAHDLHSPDRLVLVTGLRQAIAEDELTIYYQPIVDLRTGRALSVEALVRWCHPQQGFIAPDDFIPIAEYTGLIIPLTRRVLATALRQCREWHQSGLELGVAVNVSMWNLHDTRFVETVEGLLAQYGIAPRFLTLEVTESALMMDIARTLDVLGRLSRLGVRIAIDDYGTGYSSLSYLKRLPVDELKIDRSFITHMTEDETDTAIVCSTMGLAHSLGLQVVAEGVEEEVTWQRLAALGCDAAQGFYSSRPLSAAELKDRLAGAIRPAS